MAVKKIGTLNKHENPATNENEFDIENYMNANWDKIKEVVDNNAGELTSTQEKATTLQEDVEEIEGNITELQAEQTAQNKKIEEIDDNQIHITTEKSSNINVQDARGQNAKINVFGISKQETRSGKNKFNIDDLINITDQSAETGSFVASNLYGTTIINNTNLVNLLKPNTNYKCIANVTLLEKPATITSNIANMLTLYKSIAPSNNIPVLKCSNTTEKNNWQVNETKQLETTFTTDNDLSLYNMLCYCYANDTEAGGKFKFENIMILEATEQDETFEQYGASPSPEYKSDIENVTGNIDITVCNKNLFDSKVFSNGSLITVNEDGSLTLANNTNTSGYINAGKKLKELCKGLKAGDIAYLKLITTFTNNIYLQGKTNQYWIGNNSKEITEDMLEDVVIIYGGYQKTDTVQIQITKNSLEDYEMHEKQTITFPLQEGQRLMKGDYLADDGIHHVRKQVELDGTENWSVYRSSVVTEYFSAMYQNNITKANSNILCDKLSQSNSNVYNKTGRGIASIVDGYIYISLKREDIGATIETSNDECITLLKQYLQNCKTEGNPYIAEFDLIEEEIEQYTEEQQEADNQLQNAKTYKTVTNVFTENAELEMEYVADTKTYVDNEINSVKEQLNTINELLSTTTTSAMLLDNMQTDLESEVL